MRALLYECASGISGDMNLAALVDLGVPEQHVLRELARLRLDDEFTVSFAKAAKQGITGTQATVTVAGHAHAHPHRCYRDIKAMIAASPFNETVKAVTARVFAIIAEAEARIHDVEIDRVAFHEIGATDSIVDIFAAAICLDYLAVDTVVATPVELGSGFVRCAHGILPVPAPATLEILKDVPCLTGGVAGEATTPTGAGILKATVQRFAERFAYTPERIGYGIGRRDFTIPNVLRVTLAELSEDGRPPYRIDRTNVEITANIDDMSPESYEPLMECLFAAGASDVFITPILMKKSRLAHMISVLAQEQKVDNLVQVLFENSTTIGVRLQSVGKRILARSYETVATRFGDVRVKIVQLPHNGARRWKVEHDDVKRLALEHGLPYLTLRREIDAAVQERLFGPAWGNQE